MSSCIHNKYIPMPFSDKGPSRRDTSDTNVGTWGVLRPYIWCGSPKCLRSGKYSINPDHGSTSEANSQWRKPYSNPDRTLIRSDSPCCCRCVEPQTRTMDFANNQQNVPGTRFDCYHKVRPDTIQSSMGPASNRRRAIQVLPDQDFNL